MIGLRRLVEIILLSSLFFWSFAQAKVDLPVIVGVVDSGIDPLDFRISGKIFHRTDGSNEDFFKGDKWGWNAVSSRPHDFSKREFPKGTLEAFIGYNKLEKVGYERPLSEQETNQFRSLEKSMPLSAYYDFTTYAHGQHVAGIVLKDTKSTQIIPITFLESSGESLSRAQSSFSQDDFVMNDPEFLRHLPANLRLLREVNDPLFFHVRNEIKSYLKSFHYISARSINLVNMSIGSHLKDHFANLLKQIWAAQFMSEPSVEVQLLYTEEILRYLSTAFSKALMENEDKLFILAAGNRTDDVVKDLDESPQFPTSTRRWFRNPNLIVVAATRGRGELAEFSSYGLKTVDVAAPGVNILSLAPGGLSVFMTGTSQAAPYVTNTAARILEINKSLRLGDVKKIILETVDKKSFLMGFVASGGIVNPKRAFKAAELSLNFSLVEAIEKSRIEQEDLDGDFNYQGR